MEKQGNREQRARNKEVASAIDPVRREMFQNELGQAISRAQTQHSVSSARITLTY